MLALVITCVVVLPVLALAFYAMHRSKPGRFRLSVEGSWKRVRLDIEVDAEDKPGELRRNELQP